MSEYKTIQSVTVTYGEETLDDETHQLQQNGEGVWVPDEKQGCPIKSIRLVGGALVVDLNVVRGCPDE